MARGNHSNYRITLEFTENTVLVKSDAGFYPYDKFKATKNGYLTGYWSFEESFKETQVEIIRTTRNGFSFSPQERPNLSDLANRLRNTVDSIKG